MDKLTRLCFDHSHLSERMAFFEKFVEAIESDGLKDYIDKIQIFIDEYIIKHFQFEEEEIFPMIIQHGSLDERRTIQEFHMEHAEILDELDKLIKYISSCNSSPLRSDAKKIMKSSSKGIVKMILTHAQKEDVQLFPKL